MWAVTTPPIPPEYRSVTVHAELNPPEQIALVPRKAICRNTEIVLGTPAAAPAESSTRTTNEKLPAAVGLPVVLPPDDNARPGGRAPPSSDHLYGGTPPFAPRATGT